MVLPTRDDFLANALEPVEHEEHEDCWICKEPMTSPVRTPCKHDFCKHCITEWPAQPEGDTCPVCRRSLFQPTVLSVERDAHEDAVRMAERIARSDEMLTRSERLVRDMCVREASEAAVLLDDEFLRDINARTDFRSADILDLNNHIRWSEERLIQWSPDARQMLNNDLPRLPHGAVRIDAESLGTSLILMSNALMHLATAEARPWNYAVRAIWRQMVMKIWQIIAPEHGLLLVRESFYLAIMSSPSSSSTSTRLGKTTSRPCSSVMMNSSATYDSWSISWLIMRVQQCRAKQHKKSLRRTVLKPLACIRAT
jgi:hypothetical protein